MEMSVRERELEASERFTIRNTSPYNLLQYAHVSKALLLLTL